MNNDVAVKIKPTILTNDFIKFFFHPHLLATSQITKQIFSFVNFFMEENNFSVSQTQLFLGWTPSMSPMKIVNVCLFLGLILNLMSYAMCVMFAKNIFIQYSILRNANEWTFFLERQTLNGNGYKIFWQK